MTVKELKAELDKYPEDMKVWHYDMATTVGYEEIDSVTERYLSQATDVVLVLNE